MRMSKAIAIMRKDLHSFFSSPVSYVLLAAFLAMSGFFFYNIASYFALQSSQASQYQMAYNSPLPNMNVNLWVVRPFFANLAILAIFLIPIITMRAYAEERSGGTAELLITQPLRSTEIVLGKLLAGYVLYAAMLLPTLAFQGLLHYYAPFGLDWGPVLVGYFGLLLLGIGMIAIGQFISSLTRSQIIASFITFAILLTLWVVDWSSMFSDGVIADIIGYLGLSGHFENFARGVMDSSDIIYFVSFATLGVFLTHHSIENWRRGNL